MAAIQRRIVHLVATADVSADAEVASDTATLLREALGKLNARWMERHGVPFTIDLLRPATVDGAKLVVYVGTLDTTGNDPLHQEAATLFRGGAQQVEDRLRARYGLVIPVTGMVHLVERPDTPPDTSGPSLLGDESLRPAVPSGP